ncbi:HD-GYP domain-containing protein [Lacunimicrobium album]
MSTTTEPPQADPKLAFRAEDNVTVQVKRLAPGYTLNSPMYDSRGVLLLSPGSVITPRFKELLERRKEEEVQVNAKEADDLQIDIALIEEVAVTTFGDELNDKLDGMITGGSLFVKNNGPPMRSTVVLHGRKGYDLVKREELIQNHEQTAQQMDSMMKTALSGKRVSSNEFSALTGTYLTELTNDMDQLLSVAAEAGRNQQLADHCLKMSMYGMALGVEMGFDEENVRNIGLCAMIHDWGMVKLPAHIRSPQQRLEGVQHLEFKKHSIYALEMLQNVSGLPGIIPLVCYQIHEQPNGMGYPRGRKANMIHAFANILHVVDAYVEMISPKPWRGPLMPAAAMEAIVKLSREQVFDAETVRKFLMQLSLTPIGSLVKLSDGSIARVIRRNGDHYTKPIIRLLLDPKGQRVPPDSEEGLIDLAQSELTIKEPIPFPGRNEIPLTLQVLDDLRR